VNEQVPENGVGVSTVIKHRLSVGLKPDPLTVTKNPGPVEVGETETVMNCIPVYVPQPLIVVNVAPVVVVNVQLGLVNVAILVVAVVAVVVTTPDVTVKAAWAYLLAVSYACMTYVPGMALVGTVKFPIKFPDEFTSHKGEDRVNSPPGDDRVQSVSVFTAEGVNPLPTTLTRPKPGDALTGFKEILTPTALVNTIT
jgi:hypothetical protein